MPGLSTTISAISCALGNVWAQADIMPIRPGSQNDAHGCVSDGGYQWCESSQRCERVWETPCVTVVHTDPIAQEPAPLMCGPCPPPPPCPMPLVASHCTVVPSITDACGCVSGCSSVECPRAQEGEPCGGYVQVGMAGVCDSGLECVQTNTMIADAPGSCLPVCATSRDLYGNCVPEFTDGATSIPRNCVSWFDGCNTCQVSEGQIGGCTMMMCFTQGKPYCQAFAATDLQVWDICYRFCEDGSQSFVDMQDRCPYGSQCGTFVVSDSIGQGSVISFDSCGSRARVCVPTVGH